MNYCQRGGFLFGRAGVLNTPFLGELEISNIVLEKMGSYNCTFYVMLRCRHDTECLNGNDIIRLGIEGADVGVDIQSTISYGNIGQQGAWQKKSLSFDTKASNARVKVNLI